MNPNLNRRSALCLGASLAATTMAPVWAQAQPTLRFAAVFSDKDIRAEMMQMFARSVAADFEVVTLQGHQLGALFEQRGV